IARSALFVAAAVFAGGRQVLEQREFLDGAVIAVLVLVAGGVFGFASWYRTRFRITHTELRIDTGVFVRRSRRVRLDRILEIGISQPFAARLLGLAECKIETATAESEVSLAYLSLPEAHEVRRVLLEQRTGSATDDAPAGPTAPVVPRAEPRLLVRVPLTWQLKGLLASGETVAFVVFAIVVLVMLVAGLPVGAFGIGLATIGGSALSLGRKLVGWWDWTISVVPTGMQVRHGMFSLSTRTFNVERLTGVRVVESLLQRPVGLARLEVSVAGGALRDGHDDEGSGLALPVGPRDLVWRLAADLVGELPESVVVTGPPRRASWLRPLSRPWLGFGMDDRLVVSRSGFFSRRTDLVPLARVQSLRLVQGPIQRRLRLASVHADSPVGVVHAQGPHREPAEARRLVEEGVERARLARMPRSAL
ncbi:MAG: putative rane protein, partial [Nocardioidaceae bacterium]|nr:putative rane protein [Nocardioidaceae bacterium]